MDSFWSLSPWWWSSPSQPVRGRCLGQLWGVSETPGLWWEYENRADDRSDTAVSQFFTSAPPHLPNYEALYLIFQLLRFCASATLKSTSTDCNFLEYSHSLTRLTYVCFCIKVRPTHSMLKICSCMVDHNILDPANEFEQLNIYSLFNLRLHPAA